MSDIDEDAGEVTDDILRMLQTTLDWLSRSPSVAGHDWAADQTDIVTAIGALHRVMRRRGIAIVVKRAA